MIRRGFALLAVLLSSLLLVSPLGLDAAVEAQTASTAGQSRGYLTTPQELRAIAAKAGRGLEPYAGAVEQVLEEAEQPFLYRLQSEATCDDADDPAWIDDTQGIPRIYARALAYHLTGEEYYAAEVKDLLERIMTEVQTITLEQQQCRLNFSWGTPELVASADLIESYWAGQTCTGPASTVYGETGQTRGPCKQLFQNWLVKNPYFVVSYTAERAQSNWGAAATNTLAYIADYLWDRPDVRLITRRSERNPTAAALRLTPAQAYKRANQLALDRMNGYRVEKDSNSSCDFLGGDQQQFGAEPVKSQITPGGIIPEDARRDEFCNVAVYDGSYQNYPQVHLGNNIQQCELMLRRGDSSCYDNINNREHARYYFLDPDGRVRVTRLEPGRGSIERAIKAIIIDSGTEWKHDAALEVAYRYYYSRHTLDGFERWAAELDRPADCWQDVCFGTLTHGFAAGETPTAPPVVAPPRDGR